MKVIFVRAKAKGYGPTSYNEKSQTVYMPLLVEDDFNLETIEMTPVGIEQAPGLEFCRIASEYKIAFLKL